MKKEKKIITTKRRRRTMYSLTHAASREEYFQMCSLMSRFPCNDH